MSFPKLSARGKGSAAGRRAPGLGVDYSGAGGAIINKAPQWRVKETSIRSRRRSASASGRGSGQSPASECLYHPARHSGQSWKDAGILSGLRGAGFGQVPHGRRGDTSRRRRWRSWVSFRRSASSFRISSRRLMGKPFLRRPKRRGARLLLLLKGAGIAVAPCSALRARLLSAFPLAVHRKSAL